MDVARITAAARDPIGAYYALRARRNGAGLFARYARLARRAGFERLYFVLSFDCDTEDDIRVAWKVHARLAEMGVRPVFAVPGDLLRKGEAVYRRIAETGAEFINHGDREHTYFDRDLGRHASCFFYDRIGHEAAREDIVRGHETLREVLGIEARGFRTPHFGTFQRADDLRFLHRVLGELGYVFSSSTGPLYGFRFGPAFTRFGLVELPVAGMGGQPLNILDSWCCFAAPDRGLGPEDYAREGRALGEVMARGGAGLLNLYADPSHIHDRDVFFETVAFWTQIATPAQFRDLPGIAP